MILIGADEQAGCKAVEAIFFGSFGSLKQAHLIAFDAAVCDIFSYFSYKGPQGIVIIFNKGQLDDLGVFPHSFAGRGTR